MVGERTIAGWRLKLRPRGGGRFLNGAFLGVWLCGWALGEGFALWFLIKGAIALFSGSPPDPGREPLHAGPAVIVGLFLMAWLTLWTIGGIAALSEFLRLLWGEDRIEVASGRLTVTWFRGPIRRTRSFEREAIHRITLVGRDDRLALETPGRRVELSGLGTLAERREGATELRAELGIPDAPSAASVPPQWEEIITPEGERALVPNLSIRRTQARVAGAIGMALAALTFWIGRESLSRHDLVVPALIMMAFTIGLAVGTLWLARGRWEWRIGSGRLTLRKRYGAGVRDVFEARRLVLDRSSDSDGDFWFELLALGDASEAPQPAALRWQSARPRNSRTVARLMNDAATVRALAAWLARETGLGFEDRTTPQAQAAEIAELLGALENSGRFGRWAARVVSRLGERRQA